MEELIKSLIERLKECADLVTSAKEPVSETQFVRIAYGLVAETDQYPEYFQALRNQTDKSWKAFQAHFIESQANLQER